MEVKVLNISGKETGAKVQLPESVFGIEPNDHAKIGRASCRERVF